MSYSEGPFIEVPTPERPVGEGIEQAVEGIIHAIEAERPVVHGSGQDVINAIEGMREREVATLTGEVIQRQAAKVQAEADIGSFSEEARLHSPSVYVHRPDRWSPRLQERFPYIVEFLYRNEGLQFPLDETMDDITGHKYEKIIQEICTRVDAESVVLSDDEAEAA